MLQRARLCWVRSEKCMVHKRAYSFHLDLCTGEAIWVYGQLVRWSV